MQEMYAAQSQVEWVECLVECLEYPLEMPGGMPTDMSASPPSEVNIEEVD